MNNPNQSQIPRYILADHKHGLEKGVVGAGFGSRPPSCMGGELIWNGKLEWEIYKHFGKYSRSSHENSSTHMEDDI